MTSQSRVDHPPRIADWLLSLFALAGSDTIIGDLHEEFSLQLSKSGSATARRWYWRQTLKTVAHLVRISARTHPWLTAFAVLAGFLLRRILAPLIDPAMFALLERIQLFDRHFDAYRFLASTGIDLAHLVAFLMVGFVVAFVATEAEIVATTILAMIYAAMAIFASAYVVSKTGDTAMLWRLT
jgi:hypothetical protein